jgi:plastocyanin
MRRFGVRIAALGAVILVGLPAMAALLKGTVALPAGFRPVAQRHVTYWRVENGVLPIAPPLRDVRTEMIAYLEGGAVPPAAEHPTVVEINGYRFDPSVVVVAAGGTVEFRNTGRIGHVIYDKQKVMSAGSVKPGESRRQKYHAEGDYEIREEEFPHMRAVVKVLPTPLFARPDDKGLFKINNVPEGKWTVKVWYRGDVIASESVEIGPQGGDVVVRVPLQDSKPAAAGKR